jgi:hypothetical protein
MTKQRQFTDAFKAEAVGLELQDNGFAVGRRRTARLMRENDLQAR